MGARFEALYLGVLMAVSGLGCIFFVSLDLNNVFICSDKSLLLEIAEIQFFKRYFLAYFPLDRNSRVGSAGNPQESGIKMSR